MQFLLMMTFGVAVFGEYLTTLGAPLILKYTPEMFAILLAVLLVFRGVRNGFLLPAKYWFVLGTLAFIAVCGILTNSVGTGQILGGMRFYIRSMPLFILPAVYRFTPQQIERQLKILLLFGLVQVPLTAYQRYVVWSQGRFSGDDVRGTVMDSGMLSILLICAVLVLTGLFMHKRIGRLKFFALFFLLLIPTTINETKATVLLLPAGLLTTIAMAAPRGQRLKIFALGASLLVAFGAILIPIYNLMNEKRHEQGNNIVDFFTNEQTMSQYLEGKHDINLGTRKPVARGQALKVSTSYLAHDPVRLAFGLGLGNVSKSSLGENFSGAYYPLFYNIAIMSFLVFLLEMGVLGVCLVFVLYWLLYRDSLYVGREDPGITGAIAAGWVGTVVIITAGTFYAPMHAYPSISFVFWYFSGLVAAQRYQLAHAAHKPAIRPAQAAAS